MCLDLYGCLQFCPLGYDDVLSGDDKGYLFADIDEISFILAGAVIGRAFRRFAHRIDIVEPGDGTTVYRRQPAMAVGAGQGVALYIAADHTNFCRDGAVHIPPVSLKLVCPHARFARHKLDVF